MIGHASCQIKHLGVFVDYAIYHIIILAKGSANYNYCVHFEARNLQKVLLQKLLSLALHMAKIFTE